MINKKLLMSFLLLSMNSFANADSYDYQIIVEKNDQTRTQSFTINENSLEGVEFSFDKDFEIKEGENLLGVFTSKVKVDEHDSSQIYYLLGKEDSSQLSVFGRTVTANSSYDERELIQNSFDFHFNHPTNDYQCNTNYEFKVCLKKIGTE